MHDVETLSTVPHSPTLSIDRLFTGLAPRTILVYVMYIQSLVKPGSHSHDFTGDHWRLDSRGVVAGWSAARLSIVAGVVVRGRL